MGNTPSSSFPTSSSSSSKPQLQSLNESRSFSFPHPPRSVVAALKVNDNLGAADSESRLIRKSRSDPTDQYFSRSDIGGAPSKKKDVVPLYALVIDVETTGATPGVHALLAWAAHIIHLPPALEDEERLTLRQFLRANTNTSNTSNNNEDAADKTNNNNNNNNRPEKEWKNYFSSERVVLSSFVAHVELSPTPGYTAEQELEAIMSPIRTGSRFGGVEFEGRHLREYFRGYAPDSAQHVAIRNVLEKCLEGGGVEIKHNPHVMRTVARLDVHILRTNSKNSRKAADARSRPIDMFVSWLKQFAPLAKNLVILSDNPSYDVAWLDWQLARHATLSSSSDCVTLRTFFDSYLPVVDTDSYHMGVAHCDYRSRRSGTEAAAFERLVPDAACDWPSVVRKLCPFTYDHNPFNDALFVAWNWWFLQQLP